MFNNEFYQKFEEEFAELTFDPKETFLWLSKKSIIIASWGYHDPYNLNNKGFIFKVNGHHHRDWVLITLAENDTYTVRFLSLEFEENKEKITEVYCDDLQNRIDSEVERIDTYS